ncbi:MAG: hypothetical protein HN521_02540 [Candidatus Latescibacteria bacterium]|nr:hypothetical protein [Candidatus Latescibacterota bacterium]MBT5829461.1 hypothetical protein [Candidatus Latescibacterota bacterium]
MISQAEQKRRLKALEKRHEEYDPEERLVKRYMGGAYSYNHYARNMDVHPTRESLGYAVALLDTYDDSFLDRAQDVLRRIIDIQEDDPNHQHYGVWPHLMEEPLGKGPYVDRNWADFLGKDMLHVMIFHKDRLPAELADEVEASLRRAVEAIRIRNVGAGYTNIAVMGSYVTLVAGETLRDDEILERGLDRLQILHEHTQETGTFTEYNSPTYTMVALRDLSGFRHHVKHPKGKQMVDDLFRIAWETVAHHFHVPSRQWVGPNSRYYAVFTGEDVLRFIERWTSAKVDFGYGEAPGEPDLEDMAAQCPADLEDFFVALDQPRTLVQTVQKRSPISLISTTYVTPELGLGTVNHQDLWNQRRNIVAFWGNYKAPSYCRVRLMYDGYDLSTGALWTVQDKNRVLGAVTFATDGGGKHLSLEKLENGTFEAEELSLRFEFGGAAASVELPSPGSLDQPVHIDFGDLSVGIQVPFARFDNSDLRWETGRADVERVGEGSFLDVTIHRGDSRVFVLPEIQEAVVVFGLQVGGDNMIAPATATQQGDLVAAQWGDLSFAVPIRPNTYRAMREHVTGIRKS